MITELTAEQTRDLAVWRAKYLAQGWSTEPSDRPKAEAAIRALYTRLNKPAPKFVWFDSPHAAVDCIKESTGAACSLTGTDGCLDSYWIALFTFGAHIGCKYEADDTAHLGEWADLAASTGPCWPYENYCLMSERPVIATYDEREQLHNDSGPALAYKDGNAIYAIHNVRVPELVVMRPWEMTLAGIEAEENEDVRTVMQDAWCYEETDSTGRRKGAGGGRWVQETGATTVDMDVYTAYTDEETGESTQIQRALLKDKRGWQYLVCSDSSTDRVYYIRVDPEAKTCREAHMSINGGIDDSKIVVSA
jgi:hypothetical protein